MYLIQAMVQQHQLGPSRRLVDEQIAGVGVTMYVALNENHLTVQLAQFP
jgi:hypothetical protein